MLLEFFTKAFDDFKHDYLVQLSERLSAACESATRELREEITDIWFRGFNGSKTKAATVYLPNLTIGADTATCIVDTYTDSAIYATPIKASEYVRRHSHPPKQYPTPYAPSDWVLHLFHDVGNIGLPDVSTVSNWVNHNRHHYNTLTSELISSPIWGEFEALVLSRL